MNETFVVSIFTEPTIDWGEEGRKEEGGRETLQTVWSKRDVKRRQAESEG